MKATVSSFPVHLDKIQLHLMMKGLVPSPVINFEENDEKPDGFVCIFCSCGSFVSVRSRRVPSLLHGKWR